MTHVIDYAFARPDLAAVKAAGYTGVLRYVCQVNTATRGKLITPAEAAAIRAAGLDLTLNYEWYETRPLKGYQAGQDDGLIADLQADAIGYPRDCAIYFSVDFAADWGQISEYFRGVHDACARPVGVYGGLGVIRAAQVAGYAQYGWVTNAASWSGRSTWGQVALEAKANPSSYHLLQHLHSNTPFHVAGSADGDFDPNTVINPSYGQWAVNPKDRLFMDQPDIDLLRAETNRCIGAIQTTLREAITPAIVAGTTKAVVKAITPLLPGGSQLDPAAIAKAAADEVARRLAD